jgi:hypothetical protein
MMANSIFSEGSKILSRLNIDPDGYARDVDISVIVYEFASVECVNRVFESGCLPMR